MWGLVATAVGLGVLSQMAPLPGVTIAAEVTDAAAGVKVDAGNMDSAKAAQDQVALKAAADKAADAKVAAAKVAADKVATDKIVADRIAADKAAVDKAAVAKAAAAEQLKADAAAQKGAADLAVRKASALPPMASVEPPLATTGELGLTNPDAPASDGAAPSLSGLDQALTVPEAEPAPAAIEPPPSVPEGPKDALLVPGQPVGQNEPGRLPQIAPVSDPEVAALPPDTMAEPEADSTPSQSPALAIPGNQSTLPPTQKLQDKVPTNLRDKAVAGVKTDQLPQIGTTAAVPPSAELNPVQQFARPFQNPSNKPLFVILLQDVGAAGMSREALAQLPFPVSFVIDPLATDARAASLAYRAAGQEVLTLANGIPPGATAADLETTFQTLSSILPESVAVVDQAVGGFQDERALSTLVLPVIKGEARGLVTYDRGLNAADQIARRDGVQNAVIFRRLDGEGESKSTMRRYLDRAAFKAAQDGQVVVIGDTRAETVAAILEWTVEGKAGTVALAPVTAVLGR